MNTIITDICKILKENNSFIEAEQNISLLMNNIMASAISEAMELLDKEVVDIKRKQGWLVERKAHRSITFAFGTVSFKRTLMYDLNKNTHYPLDEMFNLKKYKRYSPLLSVITAKLSTKMTFRSVADILETLTWVKMSHQTVHSLSREVGKAQIKVNEIETKEISEATNLEIGLEKPKYLFIEADGLIVNRNEIKQGIFYTGWNKNGKRIELKDKQRIVSIGTTEEFFEEMSNKILKKYDLSKTQIVYNSDGGKGYSPKHLDILKICSQNKIIAQLDAFHVIKAIKTNMNKSGCELIRKMKEAISERDYNKLELVLDTWESMIDSKEEEDKYNTLKSYIKENWDRIIDWRKIIAPDDTKYLGKLGAMESNQRLLSYRMKRQGKRWSKEGIGSMVALITGVENNSLERSYLKSFKESKRKTEKRKFAAGNVLKQIKNNSIGVKQGYIPYLYKSSAMGKIAYVFSH